MLQSFDPEVTEVLKKFALHDYGDVFWDIGANKGACSYEIATALPNSKIVAIEPQEIMQGLLKSNLDILAPGRHEIVKVGIGEKPGFFDLVIPQGNRGRTSLVNAIKGVQNIVEEV